MGFIEGLEIQYKSQMIARKQQSLLNKINKANKVTLKDMKEQEELLRRKRRLLDRLREMQNESSPIYTKVASDLLAIHQPLYDSAMEHLADFKANFHYDKKQKQYVQNTLKGDV